MVNSIKCKCSVKSWLLSSVSVMGGRESESDNLANYDDELHDSTIYTSLLCEGDN